MSGILVHKITSDHISVINDVLVKSQEITDLTFICGDGEHILVSRTIMCMFSPFLGSILQGVPTHLDKVILLPDVSSSEMKQIMEILSFFLVSNPIDQANLSTKIRDIVTNILHLNLEFKKDFIDGDNINDLNSDNVNFERNNAIYVNPTLGLTMNSENISEQTSVNENISNKAKDLSDVSILTNEENHMNNSHNPENGASIIPESTVPSPNFQESNTEEELAISEDNSPGRAILNEDNSTENNVSNREVFEQEESNNGGDIVESRDISENGKSIMEVNSFENSPAKEAYVAKSPSLRSATPVSSSRANNSKNTPTKKRKLDSENATATNKKSNLNSVSDTFSICYFLPFGWMLENTSTERKYRAPDGTMFNSLKQVYNFINAEQNLENIHSEISKKASNVNSYEENADRCRNVDDLMDLDSEPEDDDISMIIGSLDEHFKTAVNGIARREESTEIESREKMTDIGSGEEQTNDESRDERNDIESIEEQTDIESSEEITDIGNSEEQTDIDRREDRTYTESREEQPDIEGGDELTDIKRREEGIDIESRNEHTDIESREEETDIESNEVQIDVQNREVRKDIERSHTQIDNESSESCKESNETSIESNETFNKSYKNKELNAIYNEGSKTYDESNENNKTCNEAYKESNEIYIENTATFNESDDLQENIVGEQNYNQYFDINKDDQNLNIENIHQDEYIENDEDQLYVNNETRYSDIDELSEGENILLDELSEEENIILDELSEGENIILESNIDIDQNGLDINVGKNAGEIEDDTVTDSDIGKDHSDNDDDGFSDSENDSEDEFSDPEYSDTNEEEYEEMLENESPLEDKEDSSRDAMKLDLISIKQSIMDLLKSN